MSKLKFDKKDNENPMGRKTSDTFEMHMYIYTQNERKKYQNKEE